MTTCQRLVSVGIFKLILLSMQINIYCLATNQMPALLVQHPLRMRVTVMLVQSLYFFQMFKIIYFIILSHYLHGKLHLTLFCYLHHRCVHGRVKPALVS